MVMGNGGSRTPARVASSKSNFGDAMRSGHKGGVAGIPDKRGSTDAGRSTGGKPQGKPCIESSAAQRYMLKRASSHVVEGECCKVQVALGIDSRASTYARIYGMW